MLSFIIGFFSVAMWLGLPIMIAAGIGLILLPLAWQLILWVIVMPLYAISIIVWNLAKLVFFGLFLLLMHPLTRYLEHAQSAEPHPATPALPKGKAP